MFPFGLYDAHCHLFEFYEKGILDDEINSAKEVGVSGFFCSALGEEQFRWYQKNSDKCFWYAGIHPYFEKSKLTDLDIITKLADEKKIIAIGEIGLDKRNHDLNSQIQILQIQLDLAQNYDLPVVFHIVGKYYDLYKILKKSFPKIRGILHGFSGSKEIFDIYKKFDIAFSIGNKFKNNELAKDILKYGFYTLETDAPYQKPDNEKDKINHLKNLDYVLSYLKKFESKNNILTRQYRTLSEVFDL